MDKKLIYVVEDDYLEAEFTLGLLQETFGDSVETEHIATHHAFLTKFEEIAKRQPACIILDVMLPWTDTEVTDQPSTLDSFMTAGVQCRNKLRVDGRTTNIPVLVYTVLDRGDLQGLPEGTTYLRKDAPNHRLIEWVKEAFSKT
jgi:CheY-like chemotaxis protein